MPRTIRLLLILGLTAALLPVQVGKAAPRRVRFEAAAGDSLLVHGEYPPRRSSCVNAEQPVLHARYRGAVEVGRASDGSLFLIGELGFEEYVKGIAEVPRSWPMEALEAQVVAARTYAMRRLQLGSSEGRALRYDLCATTACQVYVGMGVDAGPWGERWTRAVEATAGRVLLYRGKPADAFYSSTSPGRTYNNEDVFGGEPLPYLRRIEETDDGESPVARWTVRVPFADLARFLRASGRWGGQDVSSVTRRGGSVVIRGGGKRLRLTREELRDALNGVAACLDADYPQREPDGYRLPQTVPSRWYRARTEGHTLVLDGRGWGHGVGMVQWGAKGKADRGLTHEQILAAYYGGLRPEETNTPRTIRVLIAKGLRRVTVDPSGRANLVGRSAPGPPWLVRGGKRRLRVGEGDHPQPLLRVRAGRPSVSNGSIEVPIRLSGDAKVRLELLDGEAVVLSTPWRPVKEGRNVLRETVDQVVNADAIRVAADDGVDTVRDAAGDAELDASSPSPASPSPAAEAPSAAPTVQTRSPAAWVAAPIILFVVLAALWWLRRARRGAHRS